MHACVRACVDREVYLVDEGNVEFGEWSGGGIVLCGEGGW